MSDIVTKFDTFVASNPDATGSIIAFELYDSAKLNSLETGSFANRGYHLNGLVMPTWSDKANDAVCRQWARDMSNTFKTELEEHGEQTGEGVDGGVGRRGHKGAVMLYGNYDQYDERSKDIFGENFERLQKLKGRYDPGNVFDKLFPVTPA